MSNLCDLRVTIKKWKGKERMNRQEEMRKTNHRNSKKKRKTMYSGAEWE